MRHKSGRGNRARRVSQKLLVGGRPYPLQRNKKAYCKERYYAEYFRFGTKILARICYRKCHAQIALVRFVAWGFAPFWYGADPFPSKRKTVPTWVRFFFWSGLRGSNPPPPPWQGGALPNELNPRKWCLRSESNQRHGDFQSPALPTELQRQPVAGE